MSYPSLQDENDSKDEKIKQLETIISRQKKTMEVYQAQRNIEAHKILIRVNNLQKEMETLKEGMEGFSQVEELQSKIKEVDSLITALEKKSNNATELISIVEITANKIKQEAENTNKVKLDTELGASFKSRKDALITERENMKCFLYGTLFGTLVIAALSFYINSHNISANLDGPAKYFSLLYSVAIINAPLFLITWFIVRYFTRRVNEYDHLIEEYANKEALSLSFARYKETFKEIAGETQKWDALEKFTDATANELIKNPTHIFPKNKADKLPIKDFKEIFKIWNVLPDSNQTMIIEIIKNIIEQKADVEIEKEKLKMQKRAVNLVPAPYRPAPLNEGRHNDPFDFDPNSEEDVPF